MNCKIPSYTCYIQIQARRHNHNVQAQLVETSLNALWFIPNEKRIQCLVLITQHVFNTQKKIPGSTMNMPPPPPPPYFFFFKSEPEDIRPKRLFYSFLKLNFFIQKDCTWIFCRSWMSFFVFHFLKCMIMSHWPG